MMKIIKVIKGTSAGERSMPVEVEAPHKFDADSEPYEWVKITLKTMREILHENDCWFDKYGNLCSKHGMLAPAHFADLGHTFHVAKGCGFDTDSDWLRSGDPK